MIDNKIKGEDTDVEDLMEYIKGPDFPTGATILGKSGIKGRLQDRQGQDNRPFPYGDRAHARRKGKDSP